MKSYFIVTKTFIVRTVNTDLLDGRGKEYKAINIGSSLIVSIIKTIIESQFSQIYGEY